MARFPSTLKDDRWQGLNMFPITAILFSVSVANVILSVSDFNLRGGLLPLMGIGTSSVSVIHTFVDAFLIQRNSLDPIYATIMSSFLLLSWVMMSVIGVMEVIFYVGDGGCTANGNYYSNGLNSSCGILGTRFAASVILMISYLAALVVAAKALKRYQKLGFSRQGQTLQAIHLDAISDPKV